MIKYSQEEVPQKLTQRYRDARSYLTQMLQKVYQTRGDKPAISPEYIAWAILAQGIGLSLQAYLEPGAMPADLYGAITKQLLAHAQEGKEKEDEEHKKHDKREKSRKK